MAMRTITRPLAVIVFGLLCLLPLAASTGDWLWPWPHERPAVPRLSFPDRLNLSVLGQFDRWFVDRARRHLPLLEVNAAYQVGVLRRSTNPTIVFAPDGWIFYTDDVDNPGSMANFRGKVQFSEADVRKLDAHLTAMRDALSACGVPLMVAVAPNKQSIYGAHLSDGAQPPTALDDLLPRLTPPARALLLDLRPPLLAAKAHESMPLYFKTDSHWNELGAFYAYQAIVAALAKTMPVANVPLAALDRFTLGSGPHTGDLVNSLSAKRWLTDTEITLRRKVPPEVPAGAGRIVLIGDSFSKRLEPYFSAHFSSVQFVRFDTIGDALAGPARPTVVLVEVVERYLPLLVADSFDWTRFCRQ